MLGMNVARLVKVGFVFCIGLLSAGCAHTASIRIADSQKGMPLSGVVVRCQDVKKDILFGTGTNRWTLTSSTPKGEVQVRGRWFVHLNFTRDGYLPVYALFSPRQPRGLSVITGPQQGLLLALRNGYF